MADEAYLGTELKYAVDMVASGFSMADDDFEVKLVRGSKSITITKDRMIVDGQGQYYICFDSADLGPGLVTAVVVAHVPDLDFPDGFRNEIQMVDLVNIKNVKK